MSIEFLLLPFEIDFMRTAFLVAVLIAVPAGLLSGFLVLKGWALMGDAISHAVLPGVVLAYLAGWPLSLGAFAAGMLCAAGSGFLRANSRIKHDTAMGVVFAGMFALGLVIYTQIRTTFHLDTILFGDILGLLPGDVAETAAVSVAVTLFVLLFRRALLVEAFDPAQARVLGLPARRLHYGLLAAIALTVVASMQAVGIILVVALLIAPGAVGFLLTRSFGAMLAVSVAFAAVCSFAGVYLSLFIDSAPAATIVMIMTCGWVLALVFGALARRRHREDTSLSANPSPAMGRNLT